MLARQRTRLGEVKPTFSPASALTLAHNRKSEAAAGPGQVALESSLISSARRGEH